MAYTTSEGGYGTSSSVFHLDPTHADFVSIPDAQLLFTGDFKRHGHDLILTGHDGHRHVVPGYFAAEKHPALVAPNGASLSGELIDLLAGSPAPGQYAQNQPTTQADAIGKVEKIVGQVVVVRNGVAVTLHVGDAVFKSDVIQTGSGSSCGVGFPDGTVLDIIANSRMALNDYSFDPNSNSNAALFTLVEGTFAFVAGKVAHSGDMKLATPVATMGIRGTTGIGSTFTSNLGEVAFALVEDRGGGHGRIELIELGVSVSDTDSVTFCTANSCRTEPLSPSLLAQYQVIIEELFQILSLNNNPNPQSNPNPGSGGPLQLFQQLLQLFQENGSGPTITGIPNGGYGQTIIITYTGGSNPQTNSGGNQTPPTGGNIFIWPSSSGPGFWDTGNDWNLGLPPTSSNDIVYIYPPGPVTYNDTYTIGTLVIEPGAILDIVGGSLTVVNGLTDDGTIVVAGDPPTLTVSGEVVVAGELKVSGHGSEILFTNANVENSPLSVIAASHGGEVRFENSTVVNDSDAELVASHHGRLAFDNTDVDNSGSILAKLNGALWFNGSSVTNESGAVIGALGRDSSINFVNFGTLDNSGIFFVADWARAVLDSVQTTNEAGARIDAEDHARITIDGGTFNNSGTVLAKHDGVIAFGDLPGNPLPVTNFSGGRIEAKDHGIITFDNINVTNDGGAVIEAKDGLILFKESPGGAPGGITNDGAILAKDGGTVVFAGVGACDTGGLFNNGIIAAIGRGSSVDFYDSVISGGTLKADGGTIFVSRDSTFIGTVTVDISNGGLAHFADVINQNAAVTVAFCGPGTLQLDQAPSIGCSVTPVTISGFSSGDTLDLTNLRYSSHETVYYSDGVLTVVDGCSSESFTLTCGDYSACDFVLVEDVSGGTEVVLADIAVNSGDWTSVCTWSNGVPRVDDTAVIDRNVTVQLDSHAKIENLIVDKCATLDVCDCGSLTVLHTLDDSGRIDVGSESKLRVDGPVNVSRSGEIAARGHHATVDFAGSDVDNSGGIKAEWQGSVSFDRGTLDNEHHGTIEAEGHRSTVAFDRERVDNWGSIAATFGGAVLFDKSHIDNAWGASINADGRHSQIQFDHDTIDNSGRIEAEHYGKVEFDNSFIDNARHGTIDANGRGAKVEFDRDHVDNSGRIKAEWQGSVSFDHGTLDNERHGTIEAEGRRSTVAFDRERVDNWGSIAATFGGTVLFDKSRIDNAWGGTIDADGRGAKVQFDHDTIDNSGRIEAQHYGKVEFDNSFIDNARHGTIDANGRGAKVAFDRDHVDNSGRIKAEQDGSVSFDRGTLDNTRHGAIEAEGRRSTVVFDRERVDNWGSIAATFGGTVLFDKSHVDNAWGASIDADGRHSQIQFDHDTIDNSGRIEAEHHGKVEFDSSFIDNTRHGTIDADGRGAKVAFDHDHVDNAGRIEAEHGGTVLIDHSTIDNWHGTIEAVGCDATVALSRATVIGGTLETKWGGLIETAWGDSTLDHVTIARGSEILVNNGTSLTLENHIDNQGTITVGTAETNGDPALVIDGHVHLTGGGDIVLAGDDATIVGSCAGDSCNTLTNIDNTISGAGAIGDGTTDLALDNAHCGTIDANVSGKTLTIDTSHAVINQGTLEASNGGTLLIDDAVYNHGSGNALVEGGTINFAAAANVSEITFNNGSGTPAYGEVIFGDPTNCQHITVDGFTGTAPALCTSDAIDLAGTWTTSDCLVGNGGNLTITLTDTENSDTVTFTFDSFSGTLNVGSDGVAGTLITDPPANSSAPSATAGADSFVFNPTSGGTTNNAGTQNDTGTHDHAGWAHGEDWAAIAGDLQSAAAANFALHNDAAHWHHDVPAAVHLH